MTQNFENIIKYLNLVCISDRIAILEINRKYQQRYEVCIMNPNTIMIGYVSFNPAILLKTMNDFS